MATRGRGRLNCQMVGSCRKARAGSLKMGSAGSSGVLEVCVLFSHSSACERSGSSTLHIITVVFSALGIYCPGGSGVSSVLFCSSLVTDGVEHRS